MAAPGRPVLFDFEAKLEAKCPGMGRVVETFYEYPEGQAAIESPPEYLRPVGEREVPY